MGLGTVDYSIEDRIRNLKNSLKTLKEDDYDEIVISISFLEEILEHYKDI